MSKDPFSGLFDENEKKNDNDFQEKKDQENIKVIKKDAKDIESNDDFEEEDEFYDEDMRKLNSQKEKSNISSNDRFKHAICYIPFGWIFLFFFDNKKTKILLRHIKYSTWLLIVFLMARVFVAWFLMIDILTNLLSLVYLWVSLYIWYKIYLGEKIDELKYLDKAEKFIKEKWETK